MNINELGAMRALRRATLPAYGLSRLRVSSLRAAAVIAGELLAISILIGLAVMA